MKAVVVTSSVASLSPTKEKFYAGPDGAPYDTSAWNDVASLEYEHTEKELN